MLVWRASMRVTHVLRELLACLNNRFTVVSVVGGL